MVDKREGRCFRWLIKEKEDADTEARSSASIGIEQGAVFISG